MNQLTTPIFPDLEGKKILVTGAMRGLGREIAKALAVQKAHVVFNYRTSANAELAATFKDELLKLGASGATALEFDVLDLPVAKASLEQFLSQEGSLDGLVNNAGISKDQLMLRLKEEDLDQALDVNLKGAIMMTQFLTRNFLKVSCASIVNVSSVVGLMGNASQCAYAASKAGLIGFTKSYAKEMASKNVRCNAICPGFIQTDMTAALEEKAKDHYIQSIPLKRFGEAADVASTVCFLLSQASSYITGETIKIDGGLYI